MVWMWSLPDMEYTWAGPDHSARDLRAVKNHLATGGIVPATRSPDEIVALVTRGERERASELGELLNVTTHQSSGQTSPLALEIQRTCHCFIGRTAIPNGTYPTVRRYAFARPSVGPTTSRANILRSYMGGLTLWIQTISSQILFMFTQGLLVATMFTHPVVAFPVGVVIAESSMHFYNIDMEEMFWWIIQLVSDSLVYGTQMIHQLEGEPGWMTAVIFWECIWEYYAVCRH